MQYFDGNKDKKLMWSALLFGNDKGLMGGGKADSTDDACHHQKELFSEFWAEGQTENTCAPALSE